ncbi:MAG: bifunctional folylpolyglutamate synthase/dihydrofolate synthase [Campylobacteraceae bacterium]
MLEEYLSKKPLFYSHIDYEKMPRIFSKISSHFPMKNIIHVIGTNGKGSTGRLLTLMLELKGFNVGHYTSPHILNFNERIYKNKTNINSKELVSLHVKLLRILGEMEKELSYFEYTTLLAFLAFRDCDYVILEAGLGGEFDATNVVPKMLSIVTSISIDHQSFLGNSIKEIANTKLNSIHNDAIIAKQIHKEVYEVAKNREQETGKEFVYINDFFNEHIEKYAKKYSLPIYLKQNLKTAFMAFKKLGFNDNLEKLSKLNLRGRFEKIAPNLIIDVGHNEDAAKAVANALREKKVVLIYNSFKDKDYKKILEILKPIILHVEILDIQNKERELANCDIKEVLSVLNIRSLRFTKINAGKNYLVFGSFLVVEKFLKEYFEKQIYYNNF